jgi:alkylhydroperoxidase family enzyme
VLWAEHVAANTAGGRDDVFDEVRRCFTEPELVELTGICGLFAVSNRFQDSMRLPIEEQAEVDRIRQSVRADPVRLKAYVAELVEHWPRIEPSPPVAHDALRAHGAGGPHRNVPPQAGEGVAETCRVRLPDPASAAGDTGRFLAAAQRLMGGASNAVRAWANVPHVGKLVLPFLLTIERAGCGSVLPAGLKALVIARVSYINAAPYSLAHAHAAARVAEVPQAKLDELATVRCVSSAAFTAAERAALVWAQHVAQNTAKHHDAVFDELKRHFDDATIVELTGLCAETSMVNRFCNALRIPLEPPEMIAALNCSPAVDCAGLRVYLEAVLADWPEAMPVPDAMAA